MSGQTVIKVSVHNKVSCPGMQAQPNTVDLAPNTNLHCRGFWSCCCRLCCSRSRSKSCFSSSSSCCSWALWSSIRCSRRRRQCSRRRSCSSRWQLSCGSSCSSSRWSQRSCCRSSCSYLWTVWNRRNRRCSSCSCSIRRNSCCSCCQCRRDCCYRYTTLAFSFVFCNTCCT